jgi:hypothetical protein
MHSVMTKLALAALLAFVAGVGVAHAEGRYPDEYALRPLQLPTEMVQLKVPLIINLSKDNVGNPTFIPFDLRFGLSDELELDIFHPVHGLCVSGSSKGCNHAYNDLAVGLLYSVMRERGVELSPFGAFEVAQFSSPAHLRLDAGVAFKFVQAQWSIFAKPYIGIGMNHRDKNGDGIKMPIEFAFQLSRPTALFGETGFYSDDLHNLGDTWSSPVGVGINYLLQNGIDMGAEFKLDDLIGNGSSTDSRSFIFYFALRT